MEARPRGRGGRASPQQEMLSTEDIGRNYRYSSTGNCQLAGKRKIFLFVDSDNQNMHISSFDSFRSLHRRRSARAESDDRGGGTLRPFELAHTRMTSCVCVCVCERERCHLFSPASLARTDKRRNALSQRLNGDKGHGRQENGAHKTKNIIWPDSSDNINASHV